MVNRVWSFAEFEFREGSLELWRGDMLIPAETKAREVLRYLLRNAECQVLSQADIKEAVWCDTHVSDSSVNVAVNKIRDAFSGENRERILRTIRGSGYAWAVEVVEVSPPPSANPEFRVGDPAPGRPGWLLTQEVFADEHQTVWLTRETLGDCRHVVQIARTEVGLTLLRAKATMHAELLSQPEAANFFSPVLETRFDSAPYLLETEYLGPALPAWAAQQHGLSSISESLRVSIVAAAASALGLLHQTGYLHGALSAECVHLLEQGDKWLIRVDGFGHYVPQPNTTLAHRLPGAPRRQPEFFRAPELKGEELATRKGDVFALGVLLYQCVACNFGEAPILGWERRIADPVLRTDIAETAHIDPALRTREPADLSTDLGALAARRLQEEQLAQSREAQRLAEQQLALELAKKPLRLALILALILICLAISIAAALQIRSLRFERDRARAEKNEQQALQTFFERLLFDGDTPVHGPITADALTERGLQMSRTLEGAPNMHSAVLNTLGAGFTVLGFYSKAQQVLDAALAERRRIDGNNSPEVAETLQQLAALKDDESDPGAALQLARQALAIELKTLPPDDIALTRTRTQIAEDLTDLGNYNQAATLLQAALAREQGHPELLADLSNTLTDLSNVEDYRGNLLTSLGLQEQSLQIDRAMLGDRHPDIAEHLLTISNTHTLLGEYEQAASEARQALSILREWLPTGHHEIAAAQVILGQALVHIPGSTSEAETQLQSALVVLRGEAVPSRAKANALLGMGTVERVQRRYAAAIAFDQEALRIYQSLYKEPNSIWIVPLCSLAEVYIDAGAWNLAQTATRQALQIAQATLKPGNPRALQVQLILAKLSLHESKPSEAKALVEGVLAHAPEGEPPTREIRQSAIQLLNAARSTHGR